MKRRLNQLNIPDWFENKHWLIETVCDEEEPFVKDELTLYPDGDAKAGRRVFGAGAPIDHWPFAGGMVAMRRIDQPEWLVIRTPAGTHHYYRYRKLLRIWQSYVPYDDPLLDRYVRRFGPALGSFLCGGYRDIRRAVNAVFRIVLIIGGLLLITVGVIAALALGSSALAIIVAGLVKVFGRS